MVAATGSALCTMAWISVPWGTRMSGPGFCNDRPLSPMAYTVRASPSALSGCHCPSPSSRDMVSTPSRSWPAGDRFSLAAMVDGRAAEHRKLPAATTMVSTQGSRAEFESIEDVAAWEIEDPERYRLTPQSVA